MELGLGSKWDRLNRYRYLRRGEDYRAALLRRKPLLTYIGWLGHQNIGDEALYLAFRDELFKDARLLPHDDVSLLRCLCRFADQRLIILAAEP